jgi:hypothetical protein
MPHAHVFFYWIRNVYFRGICSLSQFYHLSMSAGGASVCGLIISNGRCRWLFGKSAFGLIVKNIKTAEFEVQFFTILR